MQNERPRLQSSTRTYLFERATWSSGRDGADHGAHCVTGAGEGWHETNINTPRYIERQSRPHHHGSFVAKGSSAWAAQVPADGNQLSFLQPSTPQRNVARERLITQASGLEERRSRNEETEHFRASQPCFASQDVSEHQTTTPRGR